MIMRPMYRTGAIDTTPRGVRRDRRTRWAKRMFTDALQADFGLFEAVLFILKALTIMLVVVLGAWMWSDLVHFVKHL